MRAKLVPARASGYRSPRCSTPVPGRRNEEALEARKPFACLTDRKPARRVLKRAGRSVGNDGLSVRRRVHTASSTTAAAFGVRATGAAAWSRADVIVGEAMGECRRPPSRRRLRRDGRSLRSASRSSASWASTRATSSSSRFRGNRAPPPRSEREAGAASRLVLDAYYKQTRVKRDVRRSE